MPKEIAIYLRVSGRAQDTRSQEPDLKRWAAAQAEPISWYYDSFTGTTMDRPGWSLLDANRQIIVELFPTDHRRVLGRLDRQIIVEIGGGSEPSSSLERTLGTADASPYRKRPRVGVTSRYPVDFRRKLTAGHPGRAEPGPPGPVRRPWTTAEQSPILHEAKVGASDPSSR